MDKISLFTKTAAEAYAAGRTAAISWLCIRLIFAAHPMPPKLIRNMSMTTALKWLWQL